MTRSLLLLTAIVLLALSRAGYAAYPQNPQLQGDSIYVSQQGIHKFSREQKQHLWTSLAGVKTFEPILYEDLLLVGSTQGLYALNTANGQVVWRIEPRRTLFTPSISTWAYAGSLHGELYAIEPRQGSLFWRRQFSGWIYSPAIFEKLGRLVLAGQAHKIFLLSLINGELQKQIPTVQEAVFSPIDLGQDRAGVNLFDGSSVVLQVRSGKIAGLLEGKVQPGDLHHEGNWIYRSHHDGSLSAFDQLDLQLKWRQQLVPRGLSMHSSLPGYLLLSDSDATLILLNLQNSQECRFLVDGRWHSPIQVDSEKIIYFRNLMQPLQNIPVELEASC